MTLHDIEVVPQGKDAIFDELVLNVTAKTYRYLDEEEVAKQRKSAKDKASAKGGKAPAGAKK